MPRSRIVTLTTVILSTAVLWACKETVVEVVDVAMIDVSSPPATVLPGDEFQLDATPLSARDETLQRDITWSSNNQSIAAVSPSGRVRANSAGTARITATADGVSATVAVDVSDPCQTPLGMLPIGGSRNESLSSTDCLDNSYYTDLWSLRPGTDTLLQIDLTSSGYDTYMVVGDAQSNVIELDDDGGEERNSRVAGRFSSGRAYLVLASSFDSGVTGAYRISVTYLSSCIDLMRPLGGRPGVRGRLSEIDCQFDDESWFDLWELELTDSGTLGISLNSEEFDAYLILADGNGNTLAVDNDGGDGMNSRITPQLDAGTYIIVANSFSGGETGEYELLVEPGVGTTALDQPADWTPRLDIRLPQKPRTSQD